MGKLPPKSKVRLLERKRTQHAAALESLLNTGDQGPLGAKHPAKRSLATDEAVEDVEEPNEKRTKVESAV